MAYFYLATAIVAEVVGTTALKASDEFTRLVPSLIVATAYGISFYFLSMTLRSLPVGITYAVWSGMGTALIAVAGAVIYREIPDAFALLGISLIVSGVLIMNVFSSTVVH